MISTRRSGTPRTPPCSFGAETGRPPEHLQGKQPLQTMRNGLRKNPRSARYFRLPLSTVSPWETSTRRPSSRIPPTPDRPRSRAAPKNNRQEKIVIPLAETDPDPFLFQDRDPLHHSPESGIDGIPSPEPEIEEIACDDEMVHSEGHQQQSRRCASPPFPEAGRKNG